MPDSKLVSTSRRKKSRISVYKRRVVWHGFEHSAKHVKRHRRRGALGHSAKKNHIVKNSQF